ncbi:MAG: energy transducer TonB [Candidatus Poribacteria bacterium]|nr:energy transducer TonB [Candidatus Poribacteria bacterium]
MAVGISTDTVLLKSVRLNAEQQGAISAVQARSHPEQGFQIVTPKRLSLLISLGLHLIMGLIATLYIVQLTSVDDDAVIVNLLDSKKLRDPKRRISSRKVKRVKRPQSSQVQPPRLQKPITTAVKIPTGDARYTLPASDTSVPILSTLSEDGAGIDAARLERRLLTGGRRAEIPSAIPKIQPYRSTSIIDKIESAPLPQEDFKPEPIEPLTVELSDVTQPPRFLHKVAPKYPDLARRAQKEGVVWLEASIGVDGLVKDTKVIQGVGFGCDEAAIRALKASRFSPAKQGEQAVIVRIQIPYRFKLED